MAVHDGVRTYVCVVCPCWLSGASNEGRSLPGKELDHGSRQTLRADRLLPGTGARI
jgi:hypothetical protein